MSKEKSYPIFAGSDFPNRSVEVGLSQEEIAARLEGWRPEERDVPSGFMRRYRKMVSSAARGAVLE